MLIRLACAKAKKIGYLSSRTLRSVRLCHSEENGSDGTMPSEPCLFRFARPSSVKASCHLAVLDRPHISVQSELRSVYTSSRNLGRSGQVLLGLVHLSAPQGTKRPFL